MFEWGGISVDPNREVAIANPMALPFVSKLIPRGPGNPMEQPKDAKGTGTESGIQPQYGVPYGVTLNRSSHHLVCHVNQPAWGYISALDLKTNEVAVEETYWYAAGQYAVPDAGSGAVQYGYADAGRANLHGG